MHTLHILFQLGGRAGSYQYAGYTFLLQYPGKCHFGECFVSFSCFCVPFLELFQQFWSQGRVFQKMLFCHTAVCRYSVEISVGEKSLCQKLFTLHLSFVNACKQGIWRGEEFLITLHPLFTTLHRYVVRSLPALPFLHRKGNKNIQYNRCIE